ncbi:aerial mycelium formation protein [Amycolatopsis sp. NBC_00345]|uniref:RsiG family protein n=1 Tax=Amycolatopsis sp. NBC_00345 TaxID=2975955 RepID=UPI002E261A85
MIEVRPGGRRRIDRVLAPGYSTGLGDLPLPVLRERRDEAAQEETDLSYLRRLLHARIDIVRAEQQRRSSGGESIVDQLATILADNAIGPAMGSGRHQGLEPSRAGEHRRHAEALIGDTDLTDVGSLSESKLASALDTYATEETSVSTFRRQVQGVMDTLNAEIAARYQRGAATVDELLDSERGRSDTNGGTGSSGSAGSSGNAASSGK